MALLTRRSFFVGVGASVAAPAIVRASNIMPVRAIAIDFGAQPSITVMSYFDRDGRWLADFAANELLCRAEIPGPAIFFRYKPLYGERIIPIRPSGKSPFEP